MRLSETKNIICDRYNFKINQIMLNHNKIQNFSPQVNCGENEGKKKSKEKEIDNLGANRTL